MKYDYIIVGGGSSGCIAANRLVTDHGKRVLLLEQGAVDKSLLLKMPAGTFKMLFEGSPYVKQYESEPQLRMNGRVVRVPQGNVMGGGSSVNAMAYTRGSRQDYDRWNTALGQPHWGWDVLLPYFKRQEGNQRFDNDAHGGDGPMKVSDPRYRVEAADIFVRTMQRVGLPFRSDFNAGDLYGVGYLQTTTWRGVRRSASTAFIKPILDNPLLTVITDARVNRVLFEGDRAVGVEYQLKQSVLQAHASAEVILAAGTFATPKLLMLSGIGPAEHLREHGIEVRVDLPGVGENLQDHNTALLSMTTNGAFGYYGEDKGWAAVRNALRYFAFHDGPISSNGAETVAFINLQDSNSDPDLQIYGVGVMWPMEDEENVTHGFTLMANLVKPLSRGNVRLRSAHPGDDPLINPNWLSDPSDSSRLLQALKYLRQIAATEPLAGIIRMEIQPGVEVQTDEHLLEYLKRTTESNYHPVGTCRMGPDHDPMSVLTSDLRVRGVSGLRVIDASMMPTIVSANTNAPVMAVADRAVTLMMSDGLN